MNISFVIFTSIQHVKSQVSQLTRGQATTSWLVSNPAYQWPGVVVQYKDAILQV